nr:hypothetical transcript [Hymenolepis microstoma]
MSVPEGWILLTELQDSNRDDKMFSFFYCSSTGSWPNENIYIGKIEIEIFRLLARFQDNFSLLDIVQIMGMRDESKSFLKLTKASSVPQCQLLQNVSLGIRSSFSSRVKTYSSTDERIVLFPVTRSIASMGVDFISPVIIRNAWLCVFSSGLRIASEAVMSVS